MDGFEKECLKDNQYIEVSLIDSSVDFITLENTEDDLDKIWIEKISKSLGWNYAFSH